jgi:hypothetical protein
VLDADVVAVDDISEGIYRLTNFSLPLLLGNSFSRKRMPLKDMRNKIVSLGLNISAR